MRYKVRPNAPNETVGSAACPSARSRAQAVDLCCVRSRSQVLNLSRGRRLHEAASVSADLGVKVRLFTDFFGRAVQRRPRWKRYAISDHGCSLHHSGHLTLWGVRVAFT